MPPRLPTSVRYVKQGKGGKWWAAARSGQQVHLGWRTVPHDLLLKGDLPAIRKVIGNGWGATQDFNALCVALQNPSQHLWVTFADGFMWWCTVKSRITTNPTGETDSKGHFWLSCDQPWSNQSVGGRLLNRTRLPGYVTKTAGFQGTICTPDGAEEIRKIILDEEDADVKESLEALATYQGTIGKLIGRLKPDDFELLVDLILARCGWSRLDKVGGMTEGLDLEVENFAAGEVAFVQIKSAATQKTLDSYPRRFQPQRFMNLLAIKVYIAFSRQKYFPLLGLESWMKQIQEVRSLLETTQSQTLHRPLAR